MIPEPLTPDEFDRMCRRLERRHKDISQTSGRRSEAHNAAVGGNPESKHLYAMARDYKTPNSEVRDAAMADCRRHGLWVKPYDWGFHVQGLPVGDIPTWWINKYEGG